jgi:hypothetical protein
MKIHGTAKGGAESKKDFGVAFAASSNGAHEIAEGDIIALFQYAGTCEQLDILDTNNRIYFSEISNSSYSTFDAWQESQSAGTSATHASEFVGNSSTVDSGLGTGDANVQASAKGGGSGTPLCVSVGVQIASGNALIGQVLQSFTFEHLRKGLATQDTYPQMILTNADRDTSYGTFTGDVKIKDLGTYGGTIQEVEYTPD